MSFPSHLFDRPELTDRSCISESGKKQPFLYSNSSTKIDCQFEVEMIREKYQNEYNKFFKARHQRSKSQIQKLERIIQDANDLNEILNDTNSWLAKQSQREQKKQKVTTSSVSEISQVTTPVVRWKNNKKVGL